MTICAHSSHFLSVQGTPANHAADHTCDNCTAGLDLVVNLIGKSGDTHMLHRRVGWGGVSQFVAHFEQKGMLQQANN